LLDGKSNVETFHILVEDLVESMWKVKCWFLGI